MKQLPHVFLAWQWNTAEALLCLALRLLVNYLSSILWLNVLEFINFFFHFLLKLSLVRVQLSGQTLLEFTAI